MTKTKIKEMLKTNINFLIDTVVFNNPNGVAAKFSEFQEIQNDNPEAMADELQRLLNLGEFKIVEHCLKVPFDTAAEPVLVEVYHELQEEHFNSSESRLASQSLGLYDLINSKPQPEAMKTDTTTTTLNTPIGEFSVNQNAKPKEKSKTVYYVLAAVVLVGIAFYFYKRK